jgi:two-component system, response regulator PdtaR
VAEQAKPRVLVAEDEAIIRMDLVETLHELGYDVVGAVGDGQRAVDVAKTLKPDLALLDVSMPVLDGLAAAEQISAARLCAVVMVTAFSQREVVERAAAAGAMGYVVKPYSAADLVPAIELAISRFSEVTALEQEVSDLTARLRARTIIERAKGILMSRQGLSEPEAFATIQRTAMDSRTSMSSVAEAILSAETDR